MPDEGTSIEAARGNPFIRALWVVGVGLVALGLLLQWQANVTSGYASSWDGTGDKPFDMVLLQMLWFTASPALLVGMMTIMALLFWHASQWRASRRAD